LNGQRIHALIPAAGRSVRFGGTTLKQYAHLSGTPVIAHSISAVSRHHSVVSVTVALAPDDGIFEQLIRPDFPAVKTVPGGDTRAQTVMNGLDFILQNHPASDWVLVHDAARPCVRLTDIDILIKTLSATSHGGLLGVPVADTMKQVDGADRITATVAREGLWHAYTPQMFRIGRLRAALQHAIDNDLLVTDEASAMELAGVQPRMVQGQRDNIKITVPADLELAAFYLQARKQP